MPTLRSSPGHCKYTPQHSPQLAPTTASQLAGLIRRRQWSQSAGESHRHTLTHGEAGVLYAIVICIHRKSQVCLAAHKHPSRPTGEQIPVENGRRAARRLGNTTLVPRFREIESDQKESTISDR